MISFKQFIKESREIDTEDITADMKEFFAVITPEGKIIQIKYSKHHEEIVKIVGKSSSLEEFKKYLKLSFVRQFSDSLDIAGTPEYKIKHKMLLFEIADRLEAKIYSIKESLEEPIIKSSHRIEHLEDLLFVHNPKILISILEELKNLDSSKISLKIDGKPGIIFGRNSKGEFILADKARFVAKTYDGKAKSAKQLYDLILNSGKGEGSREGYAQLMKTIFPILEKSIPKTFKGFFWGDLLWTGIPEIINGKYTFKPNTVKYSIDVDSDLGKRISQGKMGLVVHQFLEADAQDLSSTKTIKKIPDNVISKSVVAIDSAGMDTKVFSKYAKQISNIQEEIGSNKKAIENLSDKNKLAALKITDLPDLMKRFVNLNIRSGSLSNSEEKFKKWIETNTQITANKKRNISLHIQQNGIIETVFNIFLKISNMKNKMIKDLESQQSNIQSTIEEIPGGEGYVVETKFGLIKLVNRLIFSRMNFNSHGD